MKLNYPGLDCLVYPLAVGIQVEGLTEEREGMREIRES
jgi:hypothetical protein